MSIIPYIEKIAAVSRAIEKADGEFGYSIRLTRLVDDDATYTVTCSSTAEALEFSSSAEAGEYVDGQRNLYRAEAVLRELGALE